MKSDLQRQHFVELIADTTRMFSLETHAWCLLDNEYHLLIQTKNANLGRAMRHIGGVFTQLLNREFGHDGSLFKGRYRATLIEPTEYLTPVSSYIHNRPAQLGVAKKPDAYRWSSAKAYTSGEIPNWLTTERILADMPDQDNPYKAYKKFLDQPLSANLDRFFRAKRKKPILANAEYIEKLGLDDLPKVTSSHRQDQSARDLGEILDAVADAFDVDMDDLKESGRKGSPNIPRLAGLYIARNRAGRSYQEIAGQFEIANTASVGGLVSQATKSVKADPELEEAVEKLCSKLKL